MFETILDTFGVIGTILAGLIALYLITRIPWWVAEACVPSRDAVEAVQQNFSLWRRKGSDWIANFPELSVNGFFCSVLWPVTVALNLLLLAQVLEMFFPGGERIDIPKLGSYTVLSLLAGALYSIAQTMFGVIAGEAGKGKKALASLFVILLMLTIAVEMGLAGYRAREIEKGLASVGPTMVDQTFSQGIILTMFLSFIVPVAHSVLGFIALPRFIGPLVGYVPRFLGGILVWIWSFFAKFFFGFQHLPTIVPTAPSTVLGEARTATVSAKGLMEAIQAKAQEAARFREIEKRWSELQNEEVGLADETRAMPGQWQKEADNISASLKSASELQQFTAVDQKLRELQAQVDRAPRLRVQRSETLIGTLRRLAADAATWNVQLAGLKSHVPSLKQSFEDICKKVDAIEAEANKQMRILSPQEGQPEESVLNPGHAELRMIRQQAMDFGNPRTQKESGARHAASMAALASVRNELAETRAVLAPVPEQIVALSTRVVDLEANKPIVPTADDLKKREDRLRQFQMEVMNMSTTFIVTLKSLNKHYHERTRGLKQLPKGPKKRFWLLRFFSWCGQKWSGFIDMIVRSDPEPKTGDKKTSSPVEQTPTPAPGEIAEANPVMEDTK